MVTHIVGGAMGIAVLVLCVIRAALRHNVYGIVASAIYGASMIALYTISSIYHGLRPNMGKRVMQVIAPSIFSLPEPTPRLPSLPFGPSTRCWAGACSPLSGS